MIQPARQLVVDASVALAADSSTEVCAEASRQFLNTMARATPHSAVMTELLEAEWRQLEKSGSPSGWAVPWLTWMRRKSRVHDADATVRLLPPCHADLATKFHQCAAPAVVIQAMLEDLHLVEAALATEQTVISADNKVRGHYGRVAPDVEALRDICWVNPCLAAEEPTLWLRQGAPAEPARKLGFYRK